MPKFTKQLKDKTQQTIQDLIKLGKALLDLTRIHPKVMLSLILFHVVMYTHMISEHSDIIKKFFGWIFEGLFKT